MALDITDRDHITTRPPLLGTPEAALAAADRVAAEIVAGSAERERTGAVLIPQLRVVAEAGLLGISVPAEHGGPGLPASTMVEVLRRLSRGTARWASCCCRISLSLRRSRVSVRRCPRRGSTPRC